MMRSVLAVLAGIFTLSLTSFAIEAAAGPLMMKLFPAALPDSAALKENILSKLFMFCYSSLCVVAGGYVTAWLATRNRVRHALVMGVIQAALVIPAMMAYPDQAPLWQWIAGMVLIVPAAWGGGSIRAARENRIIRGMHGQTA
jgi:hypothetical protein